MGILETGFFSKFEALKKHGAFELLCATHQHNLDWKCQIDSTRFNVLDLLGSFGYTQQSCFWTKTQYQEWNMMSPAASWFDDQLRAEGSQPMR